VGFVDRVVAQVARIATLAVWLALVAPAGACAATSGAFDDPVGDSLEFAPDLGTTTVAIGDDETIAVNTRIVPRPPAGWGGCAYYVVGTCIPSNMNVTWYFDYSSTEGSVADGGADAKVVVVPARGQVFWESDRWDSANGRFKAGAQPAAAEDPGGVNWTLHLADLGIPRPATLRVWAVSLYKSYNGLGVLLNYEDTAGPSSVEVEGPPPAPVVQSAACAKALAKANHLQRAVRKARRQRPHGRRQRSSLHRRLRRLRAKRARSLKAAKRNCHAQTQAADPPDEAPPGCHIETKPVLQQEGTGIYAPWVIRSEPVVVCEK